MYFRQVRQCVQPGKQADQPHRWNDPQADL